MKTPTASPTVGVLMSGGLDSSILLGSLLREGRCVQPLYIRSSLAWETAEHGALCRFLAAVASPRLADLVVLDLPVDDLYRDHWSVTGHGVPGAGSPDEAVYLPGRNAILVVKAGLWCQLHGIGQLAIGVLGSNPFSDATAAFFERLGSALSLALETPLEIVRPFAHLTKKQVMELGRGLPLELTFSCIAPHGKTHCGRCNKCAERQAAFRLGDLEDPTTYSSRAN
ncbi:MAG: 7-cyano-7-deazaguanine synthase [Thermoguttaceae bacterium]|nr:7-cyano-7-deazaguanine synthase [Thermoguttaceae bacterium]